MLCKSLLLILEKSHNLVLSCAMATSNPTHKQTEKRQAKERGRDWEREGEKNGKGEVGRGKREANVK